MDKIWQNLLIILIIAFMYTPIIEVLINIYNSKFKNNIKWNRFAVVLIFNYFGTILYLLIGRQQKLKF